MEIVFGYFLFKVRIKLLVSRDVNWYHNENSFKRVLSLFLWSFNNYLSACQEPDTLLDPDVRTVDKMDGFFMPTCSW